MDPPLNAEENQNKILLDPQEEVLNNLEMLDIIFSYLPTNQVLKMRSVCHRWRRASENSLQRRLQVFWPETFHYDCISTSQAHVKFLEYDPGPGTSKQSSVPPTLEANFQKTQLENAVAKFKTRDPKAGPSKLRYPTNTLQIQDMFGLRCDSPTVLPPTPNATFVAIISSCVWAKKVTELYLNRCLTVEDWKVAGLILLSKFTAVEKVELNLMKNAKENQVIPAVYAEFAAAHAGKLHELVFRHLGTFDVIVSPYGLTKNKRLTLKDAEINYDLMELAPVLMTLNLETEVFLDETPDRESLLGHKLTVNLFPDKMRVFMRQTHPQVLWKFFKLESFSDDQITTVVSSGRNLFDQTSYLAHVQMPLDTRLFPAINPTKTEGLTSFETSLDQFKSFAPSGLEFVDSVNASANGRFSSVKRLDFKTSFFKPPAQAPEEPKVEVEYSSLVIPTSEKEPAFPSVATFAIKPDFTSIKYVINPPDGNKTVEMADMWFLKHAHRLAPNVQLFIGSFINHSLLGLKANQVSDRSRVLQLSRPFQGVNYVILQDVYDDENLLEKGYETDDLFPAFTDDEIQCLQGLSAIIVRTSTHSMLHAITETMLRTVKKVETIKFLGVYFNPREEWKRDKKLKKIPQEEWLVEDVDLTELDTKIGISDDLTVSTGLIETSSIEVKLDGLEDSYVEWNEI